MAVPTKEQIQQWRARWDKYPGLIDRIVDILMGDGPVVKDEEAAARMWRVNDLLRSMSDDDFCIDESDGIQTFSYDKHIHVPTLDLKGINLKGRYLKQIIIPRAHLEGAELYEAHLEKALLKYAHLEGADLGMTYLEKANISCAHLERAFIEAAYFEKGNLNQSHLEGADLLEAHLEGASLESAHLEQALLLGTHLEGANLSNANLSNVNVGRISYDRRTRFLGIRLYGCYGDPFFIRFAKDQEYIEALCRTEKGRAIYQIWYIFADCGRSIWRWAGWSVLFALLFAWKFQAMGPEAFHYEHLSGDSFLTVLYYRVVTFTTLGFGDVVPKTPSAAMWVMAEVITGYVMLGGLISILANKLARRS